MRFSFRDFPGTSIRGSADAIPRIATFNGVRYVARQENDGLHFYLRSNLKDLKATLSADSGRSMAERLKVFAVALRKHYETT